MAREASEGDDAVNRAQVGEGTEEGRKAKEQFLNAWSDPLAGVKALPGCIHTADVYGDGDWRLLVATRNKQLKVWKGTSLHSEHNLLDRPTGVVSYYPGNKDRGKPTVAVAAGEHIFFYREMRPLAKYTLAPVELSKDEHAMWEQYQHGKMTAEEMADRIEEIRARGERLSDTSLELLRLSTKEMREDFAERYQAVPLVQKTTLTAICAGFRSHNEPNAQGHVICATEHGDALALTSSGTDCQWRAKLPSAAVFMTCAGPLESEGRVIAACRNGRTYAFSRWVEPSFLCAWRSMPVGMTVQGKKVYAACMDGTLQASSLSGKSNLRVDLHGKPTCLEPVSLERTGSTTMVAVCLVSGQVKLFSGKSLVATASLPEPATALRFGQFGREDGCLCASLRSGGLTVKILPRSVSLDSSKSGSNQTGPPPEQEEPLPVPKKSRLFAENAQRERQECVEMHRAFQRDLSLLRLSAARAYVKVLTDGQGPSANASGHSPLRLQCNVRGMGPEFKARLSLHNAGSRAIKDVPLLLSCDVPEALDRSHLHMPILLPGGTHVEEVGVRSSPDEPVESIKVFVVNTSSTVPYLSALVKLPEPDQPLEEEG